MILLRISAAGVECFVKLMDGLETPWLI